VTGPLAFTPVLSLGIIRFELWHKGKLIRVDTNAQPPGVNVLAGWVCKGIVHDEDGQDVEVAMERITEPEEEPARPVGSETITDGANR
jgi:hypothetical protein